MKSLWANIYFRINILLADRLQWNQGHYIVASNHRWFIEYAIKCLILLFRFRCEGGWTQNVVLKGKAGPDSRKEKGKRRKLGDTVKCLHRRIWENMVTSETLCRLHSVLMCTAQKPDVIKRKFNDKKTNKQKTHPRLEAESEDACWGPIRTGVSRKSTKYSVTLCYYFWKQQQSHCFLSAHIGKNLTALKYLILELYPITSL